MHRGEVDMENGQIRAFMIILDGVMGVCDRSYITGAFRVNKHAITMRVCTGASVCGHTCACRVCACTRVRVCVRVCVCVQE